MSRYVDLILESHHPDRAIYVIKAVYDILIDYRIPSNRSTLAEAVEIVRGSHFENELGFESNLPPYTAGQRRVVEVDTVGEARRLAQILEEAGASVSIHPSAHEVGRVP